MILRVRLRALVPYLGAARQNPLHHLLCPGNWYLLQDSSNQEHCSTSSVPAQLNSANSTIPKKIESSPLKFKFLLRFFCFLSPEPNLVHLSRLIRLFSYSGYIPLYFIEFSALCVIFAPTIFSLLRQYQSKGNIQC